MATWNIPEVVIIPVIELQIMGISSLDYSVVASEYS